LTSQEWKALEYLLVTDVRTGRSPVSQFKEAPASATITHIDMWLDRLLWLKNLFETERLLAGIPATKLRHFPAEARSLDAAELRDI
jgi:hypothetical protein